MKEFTLKEAEIMEKMLNKRKNRKAASQSNNALSRVGRERHRCGIDQKKENTFEYQILYTNGKKSKWGQWFDLTLALKEIQFYVARSGECVIKKIVIRRIKEEL